MVVPNVLPCAIHYRGHLSYEKPDEPISYDA